MKSRRAFRTVLVLIAFYISTAIVSAHTSFPKQIKCPIDNTKFTIQITGSYTTFGTFRDFQKHGAIGDLYESSVNSCPKCHYSGYQSDFDTSFSKKTKDDILKILEPYANSKITDVLENEIAVEIYKYFNRSNDEIANLYLVASYFLKGKNKDIEKRKELQINCLNYLIKALDAKEYKKEMDATINYLIAELYRRVGSFEKAIEYFDIALNDENKKEWLLEVGTEQKELAIKKDDNNDI